MIWTEQQIEYIIREMAEDNTLACKALFSISRIRFTDTVKTMSVTLSGHPELLINLKFCHDYLETESDVKAVLMHEFLHVILLHTEKYEVSNPFLNIALDAIINAIIYRYMGMAYADLFVRLYAWEPISMLLRPAAGEEYSLEGSHWDTIHMDIYEGKYCADDLYELLIYIQSKVAIDDFKDILLLGEHAPGDISEENESILDDILKKMNGTKIWNTSKLPGIGNANEREERRAQHRRLNVWNRTTRDMLRKCLLIDNTEITDTAAVDTVRPILSNSDRHAMSRFIYSGLMPLSLHHVDRPAPLEKTTVYLDVSGSMSAELDRIISLLHHFRSTLKMPIYVFSDDVYEAKFSNQKLVYNTSYGTGIEPVFKHMRKNNISKCLIVTDGYIPPIEEVAIIGFDRSKIHILISSEGDPGEFASAGFPYQQLKRF